jgi:hypothetical protein
MQEPTLWVGGIRAEWVKWQSVLLTSSRTTTPCSLADQSLNRLKKNIATRSKSGVRFREMLLDYKIGGWEGDKAEDVHCHIEALPSSKSSHRSELISLSRSANYSYWLAA